MQELAINPHAELVLVREGSDLRGIAIRAPVRGSFLHRTTILKSTEPAVFRFLEALAVRGEVAASAADDAVFARLIEVGFLSPVASVPRFIPFSCPIEDPPWSLIPRRLRRPALVDPGDLIVNPSFRFRDRDELHESEKSASEPEEIARKQRGSIHVNPFSDEAAWVQVGHVDSPVSSALSIHGNRMDQVRGLLPGEAAPELDAATRQALVELDVIVSASRLAARRQAWNRLCDETRAAFKRDRYAVLRGLLPPAQLAATRRYVSSLIGEGHLPFGESQVERRFWSHNEPVSRFFQRQLTEFVSVIADEPLKPSYSFLGGYVSGALLAPHRDREQCAVSISLLVDFAPEPEDLSPWPLYLQDPGRASKPVAANLGLGDALLYRGTELTHWRDALPEGQRSSSIFLHYVPIGFSGSLI